MKRAVAFLFISSTAYAGGTARPNLISARGVGMGGAFTAVADDPTAAFFNPAALDDLESQVMVGGELVYGPRSYTPLKNDGTTGPAQDTSVLAPVPSIGTVVHFTDDDDQPSRFSLGFGVWNTFGGQLSYEKTGMPALDATSDIVIEADVAASLHVSDRFAVGAAARFGLGLFHVESTAMPFDSDLSASGLGVGMSLAALYKPTDTVRIGVTWRSPLRVTTKGDGTIIFSGPAERHEVRHEQKWPQQASVGVGWQTTPLWKLAAQVDWTGWSIMDELTVEFPTSSLPTQTYPEFWNDSWTFRGGAEFAVSQSVALRAGAYYDTAAVPDRTIERQYTDNDKLGLSAGASIKAGAWRVDIAGDAVPGGTRTVPNNSTEVMGFTPLINKAPGDYTGSLYTFELAVARPF